MAIVRRVLGVNGEPGLLVLTADEFQARGIRDGVFDGPPKTLEERVFRARGWYDSAPSDYETPMIVVKWPWHYDLNLVAHEYGHFLIDFNHPPKGSLESYLDVRGYGLRILDKHDLRRKSKAWRRRHGLP